MRGLIFCAIAAAVGTGAAYAQTNDSVRVRELGEISIQASHAKAIDGGMSYTPDKGQKRAAQDGVGLLRLMGILQLRIGISDAGVKTLSGDPAAIYINYVKATDQDLAGMRPADVRRVEYLTAPADPRFMGDCNVVNFIVQEYLYGGYTKLSAAETFLNGFASNASLFSKFTFRKLTWDLYVGSVNKRSRHAGGDIRGEYRIPQPDGSLRSIDRVQTTDAARVASNSVPVALRASYSKGAFRTTNTLGFTFAESPRNRTSGSLAYTPSLGSDYTFGSASASYERTLSYRGSFSLTLPHSLMLTATPVINYSHNNSAGIYSTTLLDAPIRNGAREDAFQANLMLMMRKAMGEKHYLFFRPFFNVSRYRVGYTGSADETDRIHEDYLGANIQYGYYADRVNLDVRIGARAEWNSTNSDLTHTAYPFADANFTWTPNARNFVAFSFVYSKNPMDANHKSPAVVRADELMYYTGNHLLDPAHNIMVNASYTWTPRPELQFTPYLSHYSTYSREVPVYTPYADGSAVLRRYENDGDFFNTQIGIGINAYLFGRRLQVQLYPSVAFYKSTGYYSLRTTPFNFAGALTYYVGKFYFFGQWQTRGKAQWTNSGTIYESPSELQLSAGWSNSNLNLRLSVVNPWRTSWVAYRKYFRTPVYSEFTTGYGTDAHARLSVSATYTFGYGRKLSHNNELTGAQGGASSAILR